MTATKIACEPVILPCAVTGSRLSLPSEDGEPPRLKLRHRGRDSLFLLSPCPGDALLLRLTAPCDFVRGGGKNGTCSSAVNPNRKRREEPLPQSVVSVCVHQVVKTSRKSWKKEASFSSPPVTSVFIFVCKITWLALMRTLKTEEQRAAVAVIKATRLQIEVIALVLRASSADPHPPPQPPPPPRP